MIFCFSEWALKSIKMIVFFLSYALISWFNHYKFIPNSCLDCFIFVYKLYEHNTYNFINYYHLIIIKFCSDSDVLKLACTSSCEPILSISSQPMFSDIIFMVRNCLWLRVVILQNQQTLQICYFFPQRANC